MYIHDKRLPNIVNNRHIGIVPLYRLGYTEVPFFKSVLYQRFHCTLQQYNIFKVGLVMSHVFRVEVYTNASASPSQSVYACTCTCS